MQKLLWINSEGEELDLTNHTEYGVTEWEGFAGTELNIQSQQVPFQDGSVFLDALLSERELTITLAMKARTLKKRYELRRELIHKLNPKLGEGVLIYQNDFIKKQIKCVPHIPIFETHNSDTVGTPKASLTWTANNPYWEDVEETTIKFMGTMRNQIEYDGDVETGVNLEYIGYSASLKIENVNDKKEIELQGIGTNRKIDISTLAGNKTISATDLYKKEYYTGFPFYDVCVANDYIFFITLDLQGGYVLSYMDTNGIMKESKIPALCGRFKYLEPVIYCESREEYYIYIPSSTKFYSSSDLITWTESQYLYKDVGDWVVRVDTSENWEISSDGETFTPSTMTDFMYVEDLGYYAIDNNNMYYDADDLSAVSVIKHEDSPYRFNYLLQFGEYVVAVVNYGTQGANAIFKNNVEVTDYIFGEYQYLTRVVPFRNDFIGYLEGGTGYRLINKNFQTLNGLKYQDQAPQPLCTYKDKLYLLLHDEGDIFNIYGTTENLTDYTVMDNNAFTYGWKSGDVYYFVDFALTHGYNYLYMSGNLKNLEFVEELQIFGGYIKDDIISGFGFIDMDNHICLYKIENYHISERIVTPILSYNNGHRKFGNKLYVFAKNGLWESSDLENWTQSYNGENVLDLCITENNKIVITDTKYYLNDMEQTAPAQFKKVEWSDYYQKFLFISDSECYSSMDGLNFEQVEGIEGSLVDILYDEKQTLWWILAETTCYTYYMDLLSQIECSGISGSLCLTDDGVLIVNRQMQEIVYSKSTNLINKMTGVSNMSFGLKAGANIITFNGCDKDVLFLKYRRRYIGV